MKPISGSQNLTISRDKIITRSGETKLHKHGQRPLLEPISGQGIMLTVVLLNSCELYVIVISRRSRISLLLHESEAKPRMSVNNKDIL